MNDYITIPLAKRNKSHNMVTKVDLNDADLGNVSWNTAISGKKRYVIRTIFIDGKKTTERMHRVILERKLERKLKRGEQVDHINHDGFDNRRSNLRLATGAQNQHNKRLQANSTSGYKGVNWHKGTKKWQARIGYNGKRVTLGYFNNPEDAHKAYCEAADELHGKFANYGKTP
jgi:hypothetical protein